MRHILREEMESFSESVLNRQIMLELLKTYKRPNDKINEMVNQGEITAVKRGVYIPGPKSRLAQPEPFLIANHLRGPSYVSLESALSYWELIPERVYEITSVTVKSTRTYKTPLGRFRYLHTPLPYYAFGIVRMELTPKQTIMIASREKAICDKIIMTPNMILRSIQQTKDFLIEDLRMDEALLKQLDKDMIASWVSASPKKTSITMLIKTINAL